jgi:hypothetical protein
VLGVDFQVFRVLAAFDSRQRSCRRPMPGWNAKVHPNLGDAATVFVFRRLNLYPATQ